VIVQTSGEILVHIAETLRVVASPNVALFLDVDGTLLDIADTPDAVSVPVELVASVRRAENKLDGALALISGRVIEDIDRLFDPLRLRASGVHGAQIRLHPDDSTQIIASAIPLPSDFAATVDEAVRHFPGILIENKRFSVAVHYRLYPQAARWLRETLQELLRDASLRDVEIQEALYAFELKPRVFDKGKAIASFLSQEPFRGRKPIFVGDDTTDQAGFAEVHSRGGRAYSVGRRRPGVVGFFESPHSVRDWLAAFAAGEGE
jgi:trehalose 6-phosphate phosphatase